MTRTPLRRIPVLLVAMLALGVALVGTATVGNAAAAITKAQVKKIAKKAATKVVKKAAPTLTVGNAGNATNLGGQPPAAYLDNATVYTASIPSSGPVLDVELPIPAAAPGSYLVNYSVWMGGAAFEAGCEIFVYTGNTLNSFTGSDIGQYGLSGSAVVTLAAGQTMRLYCASTDGNTFYTSPLSPIQVAVSPLDAVSSGGPLTALPRATAGRPGGK